MNYKIIYSKKIKYLTLFILSVSFLVTVYCHNAQHHQVLVTRLQVQASKHPLACSGDDHLCAKLTELVPHLQCTPDKVQVGHAEHNTNLTLEKPHLRKARTCSSFYFALK